MKASEMFPSRWLKAADLDPDGNNVTIGEVTMEEIGEERESKPVVSFGEIDKVLVLNITNCNSIVELTGEEDSDNWPGHRIKLVRRRVSYGAKMVDAIRIEPPDKPKPLFKKSPSPAQESVVKPKRVTTEEYDPY